MLLAFSEFGLIKLLMEYVVDNMWWMSSLVAFITRIANSSYACPFVPAS
jgi:hypothetical protein